MHSTCLTWHRRRRCGARLEYGGLDSNWVPDLVGRAWGNRGNARSRQGKLQQALADYNTSIGICPWSVDPVLNRGVVLEALGRWDQAISDYRAVLAVAPEDPAAWNNLGNASAGAGDWAAAAEYYGKATQLAPAFAFARGNRALALYQLGQDNAAIKEMRSLLRKFPDSFPDMRAALAAALWEAGLQAEAEAEWQRVNDPRYRDRAWLRNERRWPPRAVAGLEALLDIRGVRS
ncbi:TPR repeat-containing [Micractinium conductrix]|uniref:TPR repeat-containing n=1 Tax=Micractinium conductrix TaxID=554055 RepID=A0A2P6VNM2_9CHLO|nr:TPR repeat-containing [Micractinium conductrix]|eukprot:PSC75669.1 TPR repeat-containing [Micractinium conductrix]